MARPRKAQALKNQPITISLPPAMIAEVDDELSYRGNRSAWIQGAIESKLKGSLSVPQEDIPSRILLEEMLKRVDSTVTIKNFNPSALRGLYTLLLNYFDPSE